MASTFLVGSARLLDEQREKLVWGHLGLGQGDREAKWPSRATREAELLGFVQRFATRGDAEAVLSAVEAFCKSRKLWLKVAGGDKACVLEHVVTALKPESVLEVGCYVGFSAVRLGAAVQRWGGRVLSLEMDPVLAFIARQMVSHAGLSATVEIRIGHSDASLEALGAAESASFDLVFFDQRGSRFREDLEKLDQMGALRHNAVIVADNALKPGAPKFLWHVCATRAWQTLIVELRDFGSSGVLDWMSVSRKAEGNRPSGEASQTPQKIQQLAWQADEMRWRSLDELNRMHEPVLLHGLSTVDRGSIDYHVTPQEWTEFAAYMKRALHSAARR